MSGAFGILPGAVISFLKFYLQTISSFSNFSRLGLDSAYHQTSCDVSTIIVIIVRYHEDSDQVIQNIFLRH